MSTARLVRMANQIAASVPDRALVAEQTAAHLKTFWTTSMIATLAQYASEDPEAVEPSVLAALDILRA